MNTKSLLTRTVIVFAALAAAGIVVAVSAQFVADSLEQTIMVALGSALFGASLAFFLVRLFSLVEK
jgi:hypothetical protein